MPARLAAVDFTQPHNLYNAVEAGLWWVVAGILLLRRTPRPAWGWRAGLCGVLAVFGASDVWELFTGAWWRPWPLAALKFACGGAGCLLALAWWRCERRLPEASGGREPAEPRNG